MEGADAEDVHIFQAIVVGDAGQRGGVEVLVLPAVGLTGELWRDKRARELRPWASGGLAAVEVEAEVVELRGGLPGDADAFRLRGRSEADEGDGGGLVAAGEIREGGQSAEGDLIGASINAAARARPRGSMSPICLDTAFSSIDVSIQVIECCACAEASDTRGSYTPKTGKIVCRTIVIRVSSVSQIDTSLSRSERARGEIHSGGRILRCAGGIADGEEV